MSYDATYWLACVAFQRLLGGVYLLAFWVALRQFCALQGERGLEPVAPRLGASRFWGAPSLFHLHYSDRFFRGVSWLGLGLAALAFTGLADQGPLWLSLGVWALLWLLYLSVLNIGGTFYGYGWESKLLDVGFLAIFLGPSWMQKPVVVVYLLRWLLLRVELGAGLIKMRGDRCWRELTCMRYHHETQPMPNRCSWRAHNLPAWFHRLETLGNHAVQLGVVWLILAPQPVASVAGAVILATQLWLLSSGNYAWLNVLTIAVALPTVSDGAIASVTGLVLPEVAAAPPALTWATWAVAALTAALSVQPVQNLCSRNQRMNYSFNPLHLVNAYGAFGSVTRRREEVVLEGTRAETPDDGAAWREYAFRGKPGALDERPRQVAPYHERLAWQLWFLPLRASSPPRWFLTLLARLLEGDAQTVRLLAADPFPEGPPRYLRARLYRYRFTTPAQRRQTKRFWQRELVAEYLDPVDAPTLAALLRRPVVLG